MTNNLGKSTPRWPSTWQGKSNGILYAFIGDVPLEEMINKVNGDSLLLVFRLDRLDYQTMSMETVHQSSKTSGFTREI